MKRHILLYAILFGAAVISALWIRAQDPAQRTETTPGINPDFLPRDGFGTPALPEGPVMPKENAEYFDNSTGAWWLFHDGQWTKQEGPRRPPMTPEEQKAHDAWMATNPSHKFEGITLRNGLPDDPVRMHNDGVLVVHEAFEVRHIDGVATNWTSTNLVLVTHHKPVVMLTTNGWEVRLAVGSPRVPDPTFDEGAVFGAIATRRNPDVNDFATVIKLAAQLRALEVQRLQNTPSSKLKP